MADEFRFQSIYETKKSGFRVVLKPICRNYQVTLKVGDFLPDSKFYLKEASNVTKYSSDFVNAYIIVTNDIKTYKITYKTPFTIKVDSLEKSIYTYDAHMQYELTLTEIK
jgi:hypothetical protein